MPRRNFTKVDAKVLEKIGKRHLAGENADALAKEFKVSRASIFNYSTKYKTDVLERTRREGMSKAEIDRMEKADLLAAIKALTLENRRLREQVLALTIEAPKNRNRRR